MTAADRRRVAYELHRRFLLNVTGLEFGPAYLSAMRDAVCFRSIVAATTERGVSPVEIVSVIREPAEFHL